MRKPVPLAARLFVFALLFAVAAPASAQYFGRNKVQYDDFEFKVIETEHFEIYYYPEEEEAVHDAARMAERWYARHSQTFSRVFREKKPIIFYANDADFHQTNIIGGFIGEGPVQLKRAAYAVWLHASAPMPAPRAAFGP